MLVPMIGRVHSKKERSTPRAPTAATRIRALFQRQSQRDESCIAGVHDDPMMPSLDGIAQGKGGTHRRYPLRTPIPRLTRVAKRP